MDYDFALLRLSQAVDFTDSSLSHVFPACWPSSEPTIEGQEVICYLTSPGLVEKDNSTIQAVISGWGTLSSGGSQPINLQKVGEIDSICCITFCYHSTPQANVQIISRDSCNSASSYSGSVTTQMICAGFLSGGIDTCQVIHL